MLKRLITLMTLTLLTACNEPPKIVNTAEAESCSVYYSEAPVEHTLVYDSDDVDCLARNIYFEARNQSTVGKVSVAMVTLNRVASSRYPDNVCDVVHQKKNTKECQFAWYCDGKSDKIENPQAYNDALEIAQKVMYNYDSMLDPTDGALYYHSTKVSPVWTRSFDRTVKIDDHIFYKRG